MTKIPRLFVFPSAKAPGISDHGRSAIHSAFRGCGLYHSGCTIGTIIRDMGMGVSAALYPRTGPISRVGLRSRRDRP